MTPDDLNYFKIMLYIGDGFLGFIAAGIWLIWLFGLPDNRRDQ